MNDKQYWDQFYAHARPGIAEPSTFARFCAQLFEDIQSIYELGCGNGRDLRYFASLGHMVGACDRSEVAIQELAESLAAHELAHVPQLDVGEMGNLPDREDHPLNAVYSRFTLHAVDAAEASRAMRWSYRNLAPGGHLLAEARSVKGSLYGKGVEIARDTFLYNEHTRRFLRRDELIAELSEIGFSVLEAIEADGLAVYKDDDPVVIRVIASK